MGFLDNSGDIILDATLTDEGRKRLARGEFNVVKFSLGDDEIDYSLFRNSNHTLGQHPSGSAYYDLEILQTPVLEAMTNANSSLKSALVTYGNNLKFHLPVLRLNTLDSSNKMATTTGSFHVASTKNTADTFQQNDGTLNGNDSTAGTNSSIRIDQGLDVAFKIPADQVIPAEDLETGYFVYMDNRLGELSTVSGARVTPNFIDDDNIATYTATLGTGGGDLDLVRMNQGPTSTLPSTSKQVIQGPRGTIVEFKIRSSSRLRESNVLFTEIGSTGTLYSHDTTPVLTNIRFIDATIRVVGATTGYKIDIPVRYIKLSSE
jgi:hypothetical protein